MSLLNVMNSGVSGLNAESDALTVVGNNVANSNTVGFKQSRAIFENVLGGAANVADTPSGASIGAGVKVEGSQQLFTQGTLTNTGNNTDLAISGDGFFVVQGSASGNTGTFYTRAGQTHLDNTGTLVNPDGLALQGYQMNANGTVGSTVGNIQLRTAALPPKPTSALTVTANLNSAATVATSGSPAAATPFDPQNPSATSDLSSSMKVFDSLGNSHDVSVYFQKDSAGQWTYHALANGSEVTGGTAGQSTEIATGTLTFNANGSLQSAVQTAPAPTAGSTSVGTTVSFAGATANQPITFNFGTPVANGGTGLDGMTQFGSASNVSSQKADGYASGDLSGVSIGADGTVSGVYTNGQSIAVGQLALAKFPSNDGLAGVGQNLWTATNSSGTPALAAAGSGGRGSIASGSLEQSNVDVANSFVDLITHQRAFEANSKTITTADQMLQALMNIKQ